MSLDGSIGYYISISKPYKQGNRDKYWYGYRHKPFEQLSQCKDTYVVFGLKNNKDSLIIPKRDIDELVDRLNYSQDDDGSISHWHIVFFRDTSGHMTQLLSSPELEEIDVNAYKLAD